MKNEEIHGWAEAEKVALKWKDARYCRLERLEKYEEGTQYEGRADFFEPEQDVPLTRRAPCIVHSAVEIAIAQHVDFAFGEGRFPSFSTGIAEDDEAFDDLFALSEDDSKIFDAYLSKLSDAVSFHAVCDEAMQAGESVGTAIGIVRANDGELTIETTAAKWSTAKFGRDGKTVESVTIQYPYIDVFEDKDGKEYARCMLYRREIDATSDVVFEPVEVKIDTPASKVRFKESERVEHKLGYCPVIWWRRKRGCSRRDELDGRAIHASQLDELDALNLSLSQRQRAVLYAGDPQMYEIGVDKSEQVAPRAMPMDLDSKGKGTGFAFGTTDRPRNARKKGAGVVWRYENENAKVDMMFMPGEVISSMKDHAHDIEERISSALGYTKLEIQGVRGAMSGKALAFLYARTTAFVDRERRDIWDGFMKPCLSMLTRVCYTLTKRGDALFIPGLTKVMPLLERCVQQTDKDRSLWRMPPIKATWGDYFPANADDEKNLIDGVVSLYTKGLIPLELALEKLRPLLPMESPQAVIEMLEKEKARAQENDLAHAQKRQALLGFGQQPSAAGAPGQPSTHGGPSGAAAANGGASPRSSSNGGAKGGALDPKSGAEPPAAASPAGNGSSPVPSANAPASPAPGGAAAGISQRAQPGDAGIAHTVFEQMKEDFDPKLLGWVLAAQWHGPIDVPLDQIDFSGREEWRATYDPDHVDDFTDKARAGQAKPIILVNEPNNDKLMVVDGHHRLLAAEKAGVSVRAYVGNVTGVGGPWEEIHSSQRGASSKLATSEMINAIRKGGAR